jgi:hypothetical protein
MTNNPAVLGSGVLLVLLVVCVKQNADYPASVVRA